MTGLRNDPEFRALRTLSARAGTDPLTTQAAGGNTSLKRDGTMWIKASGTWLAHAETRDIFVPVATAPLLAALAADDPRADTAVDFVVAADNPSGLRPSIETSVHAVVPFPVVIHVHCVATIAQAVRAGAARLIGERLDPLDDVEWVFVPYHRPGTPLSRAISERIGPHTNVIVLGNHGLVVAAGTVAAAGRLLARVSAALGAAARTAPTPDLDALGARAAGTPYRLPADPQAHALATDPESLVIARTGSLYPDHVIFLGPGIVEVGAGGSVADAVEAAEAAGRPAPPMLVLPGLGVLMHETTPPGADAMARCLADVAARIPAGATVTVLTAEQESELVNWDAEKYRQALAKREREAAGR